MLTSKSLQRREHIKLDQDFRFNPTLSTIGELECPQSRDKRRSTRHDLIFICRPRCNDPYRFCLVCRALLLRRPPNIARFAFPVYFTANAWQVGQYVSEPQHSGSVEDSSQRSSEWAYLSDPPDLGGSGEKLPQMRTAPGCLVGCVCPGYIKHRSNTPGNSCRTGPNG